MVTTYCVNKIGNIMLKAYKIKSKTMYTIQNIHVWIYIHMMNWAQQFGMNSAEAWSSQFLPTKEFFKYNLIIFYSLFYMKKIIIALPFGVIIHVF